MDETFALAFDLTALYEKISYLCPTIIRILHAFSTTTRQKKEGIETTVACKQKVSILWFSTPICRILPVVLERVSSAALTLLGERSQKNSYTKHTLGLYLYATGAQCQVISVLSSLGVCSSYSTIAGTSRWDGGNQFEGMAKRTGSRERMSTGDSDNTGSSSENDENDENEDSDASQSEGEDKSKSDQNTAQMPMGAKRGMGLLPRFSDACRTATRSIAGIFELGHVYDNINFVLKVAEQILGHKESQENGTCATVYPLYGARKSDMKTSALLNSYDRAPPLKLTNILLDESERTLYRSCMIATILRIVVKHGGPVFHRFREDV
ncbi:hypothetical protein PHLCEN_2v3920 [Hermanssonia centrifuga]|uniref:Uncharacterized protein n=1 Tax=Hermanssonia centrifuga TaxID=98765 RepID=A0A2R6QB77_9APHY|nr:hypothetical protein PHLCEN_2v3920 [Hermanssonia centrifuga]